MKPNKLHKFLLLIAGGIFVVAATLSIVEVASSGASLAKLEKEERILGEKISLYRTN